MRASAKIRKAMDGWEGNVLTCYLDPVGIPTIGKGFTNRSRVLTEMLGKIKPGVTKITAKQSDQIFSEMLTREYEPMINMPGAKQHEFDTGVSTVWNLGPRSQNWNWAKLWRAGKVHEAANYLATHYNTAAGRRLPGLVRRRREEAAVLEFARYPGTVATASRPAPEGIPRKATDTKSKTYTGDPVTFEAQERLTKLGIDPGKTDGWYGKKTEKAVLIYQQQHPHLSNDGILGPATLAQLRRDSGRAKKVASKVISSAGLGGGLTWVADVPTFWVAFAVGFVAVLGVAYFGWKYRDIWQRRNNKRTNKTIEV